MNSDDIENLIRAIDRLTKKVNSIADKLSAFSILCTCVEAILIWLTISILVYGCSVPST